MIKTVRIKRKKAFIMHHRRNGLCVIICEDLGEHHAMCANKGFRCDGPSQMFRHHCLLFLHRHPTALLSSQLKSFACLESVFPAKVASSQHKHAKAGSQMNKYRIGQLL